MKPFVVQREGVIEDALVEHVPQLSKRAAKRLLRSGRITLTRHTHTAKVGTKTPVLQGDVVAMTGESGEPLPIFTVLAQTQEIILVNKPHGVHTLRNHPGQALALADAVAQRFPECERASNDLQAGALHRLDRDTSGVVAFARTTTAFKHGRMLFSQPWSTASPIKLYLAICTHVPGLGSLSAVRRIHADDVWHNVPWPPSPGLSDVPPPSLAFDIHAEVSARGALPRVRTDGLAARSVVMPWQRDREHAAFVVWLHTGRRHQVRAHLAALGWPIVGDVARGGPSADRLMLHAWSLHLPPPLSCHASAALPDAFVNMLASMRPPALNAWPDMALVPSARDEAW